LVDVVLLLVRELLLILLLLLEALLLQAFCNGVAQAAECVEDHDEGLKEC
jgi:hypothetical protein